MIKHDKKSFLDELVRKYQNKHRESERFFRESSQYQISGGSHNLRLFFPFPFYDVRCQGSKVWDMDGNMYIDFWQGHFTNILGHNPDIILNSLTEYFAKGQGLETGFPGDSQVKLAMFICESIHAEKIRFTTSGTLASMYSIMLAKSYTNRELILKVGGGWHGAQPYVLKGITAYDKGFNRLESAGLPSGIEEKIIMTRFNDIEDLEDKFREHGERIACLLIEPFIGAGGFIFGEKEYIQKARDLATRHGSVLIFDEVVSGFRFCVGGIQNLYEVKPDLTILGKAIGGGMPVSAVAGREDIMALCGPDAPVERKVKFEGGTFSAHPACIFAGLAFIEYLIEKEKEIYPKIGQLASQVRNNIEEIFHFHNINVRCTGDGGSITPNSSLVGVHFLRNKVDRVTSPDQVWNPEVCHVDLREKFFKLAMLEEGFNIFHGFGAISTAHTEDEMKKALEAVERIAEKWERFRFYDS